MRRLKELQDTNEQLRIDITHLHRQLQEVEATHRETVSLIRTHSWAENEASRARLKEKEKELDEALLTKAKKAKEMTWQDWSENNFMVIDQQYWLSCKEKYQRASEIATLMMGTVAFLVVSLGYILLRWTPK